ncbi:hypothetical protein [Pseudomonas sp. PDM07]|jgi:hypothetical protein|uniref:hypothetical protein n=1 Tax=Pseudomonas TaxID=286 RepID=UPI001CE0CB87|nr:hypothetical protein [Pseudomonas sp. PDM07]
MKLQTFLTSLFCCASFFANATDVPIKEGMPFLKARKALIQNGWKPNPTYSGEFGVENIIMRNGFKEIESCTEGVRYCSFNYIKNETCLGVGTVGEKIKEMKIYSWNFKCPEKD